MRRMTYAEKASEWVVDYSAARAKAIEWLGDRYLLARPVRRRRAGAGQSFGEADRQARNYSGRMVGHS